MSKRNLLEDPCWEAKDLGQAMPISPHAVSVALPRWKDVVAYEEKEPTCINALQAIYPRFGLTPLVSEVAKHAQESIDWRECSAWPYPNIATARKAKLHCDKSIKQSKTTIQEVLGLHCLITDSNAAPAA